MPSRGERATPVAAQPEDCRHREKVRRERAARSPDPHDRDSESRDRPVVDQDRSGSPNPRAERRELPMDDRATKRTERVPTPVMK